ncbi:MAG: sterol desaturase family protein [Pseudomonadota bacterium]
MDLIALAVPLFVIAILVELAYGLWSGNNTYRLNDSVSSLFLGVLSQARKFITLGVGGYIYYLVTQHFSLPLMNPDHWWTWVLAMVLYDFCYYWLHRLGHERSILWAAHVAHHQSEDYNLSTALRQTSTGFLLGWIFYIPMYLLGIPAEVVVSVGALNLLYQFWVHTQHVPKLGWYEWLFVTPSNHRVHHAQNDLYMDRNYGGLFIIWDRLFGTFQEELDEEPAVFGIRGPLRSFSPWRALTHIYVDMAQDSWRAASGWDKLKVWVARTGWRPVDVAASYPREKNDLSSFERYDPRVSVVISCYGFFQLLAVVALLVVMQSTTLDYWHGVSLWLILLSTTVVAALWLDGRGGVFLMAWDAARLAAIAGVILLGGHWLPPHVALVGWLYVLINLIALPALQRLEAPMSLTGDITPTMGD